MLAVVLIALGIGLFWVEWGAVMPVTSEAEAITSDLQQGAIDLPVEVAKETASDSITAREAVAEPSEPPTAEDEGILLEVVYRETGQPAPNAEVYLRDHQSEKGKQHTRETNLLPMHDRQLHLLAPKYADAFVTDAAGKVRFHPAARHSAVYVETGDGYSTLGNLSGAVDGVLRLELWRITEIPVLVREKNGQPIRDMQVSLGSQMRGNMGLDATGYTNQQGLARVRLTPRHHDFGVDAWDTVHAQVISRLARFPSELVTRDPRGEEPILLEVEAGTIEVLLPTSFPQDAKWPPSVTLERVGASRRQEKRNFGDRVVFQGLPLGGEFTASLSLANGEHFKVEGRGPSSSGEVVVFELVPTAGPPELSFRLVDDGGNPITGEGLMIEQGFQRWGRSSGGPKLDAEGRGVLALDEARMNAPHFLHFSIEKDGRALSAILDLPGEYPPGVTDLGDVTMALPPLVLAGRVVQAGGQGIPGVDCNIRVRRIEGEKRMRFSLPIPRTDEDGAFELRSWARPRAFLIRPMKEGWIHQDWADVEPGRTALQLIMHRAGSVKLSLLTEYDKNDGPVYYLASEVDGSDIRPKQGTMESIGGDRWELHWDSLIPGSYRLEVCQRWPRLVMHSQPAILVVGGEERRLEELDLRGKFRKVSITVVDANGDLETQAGIHVDVANGRVRGRARTDRHGRREFMHWGERMDLIVDAGERGYRRLEDVREDTRVVLEPQTLRLSLEPSLAFLGQNQVVKLSITPRESAWGQSSWKGIDLLFGNRGGEHEVALPMRDGLEGVWTVGRSGTTEFTELGRADLLLGEGANQGLQIPPEVLSKLQEWARSNR